MIYLTTHSLGTDHTWKFCKINASNQILTNIHSTSWGTLGIILYAAQNATVDVLVLMKGCNKPFFFYFCKALPLHGKSAMQNDDP